MKSFCRADNFLPRERFFEWVALGVAAGGGSLGENFFSPEIFFAPIRRNITIFDAKKGASPLYNLFREKRFYDSIRRIRSYRQSRYRFSFA